MPTMGMAAMKTVVKATEAGGGMYEGKGDLGSGGTWRVTITAHQDGKTIANKRLTQSHGRNVTMVTSLKAIAWSAVRATPGSSI
jgi:hypothetical protein